MSAAVDLRNTGIVNLPAMTGAKAMATFLSYCKTYHGHVKGASVAKHQEGNSTCWAPEDILKAPYFFEYALGFTELARAYLGQEPLLYSVNAFTTYPISGPMNPDIQEWHRDKDDSKFLALFVYLSDVLSESDGAHLYKLGTHNGAKDGPITTVMGRIGTAFIADGRGLHMGIRPVEHPRTIAWARWGVSDPPASYLWDKQSPVSRHILGDRYPAEEKLQKSIRLVVQ